MAHLVFDAKISLQMAARKLLEAFCLYITVMVSVANFLRSPFKQWAFIGLLLPRFIESDFVLDDHIVLGGKM